MARAEYRNNHQPNSARSKNQTKTPQQIGKCQALSQTQNWPKVKLIIINVIVWKISGDNVQQWITTKKSFFIGPKSIVVYHCQWLTDWLTNSYFVDLTDVTLAFKDTNSKLPDVSDNYAEGRVDDEILKLKLDRDFDPEF